MCDWAWWSRLSSYCPLPTFLHIHFYTLHSHLSSNLTSTRYVPYSILSFFVFVTRICCIIVTPGFLSIFTIAQWFDPTLGLTGLYGGTSSSSGEYRKMITLLSSFLWTSLSFIFLSFLVLCIVACTLSLGLTGHSGGVGYDIRSRFGPHFSYFQFYSTVTILVPLFASWRLWVIVFLCLFQLLSRLMSLYALIVHASRRLPIDYWTNAT